MARTNRDCRLAPGDKKEKEKMNREIKFRGIWEDTNRWVYGLLALKEAQGSAMIQNKGDMYYCHRDSIGQYTGLKDKNGKEIYEGDIIKSDVTGTPVPVAYELEYAQFTYGVCEFNVECAVDKLEVLGNIYEHPHLLTPTDK